MNYGLIARKDGLSMIRLPDDFDLQMMSLSEFNDLLTNSIHRVPFNKKLAVNLIDDIGYLIMFNDYDKIYKLQSHEYEMIKL